MSKLLKSALSCSFRISGCRLSLGDILLKRPLQAHLVRWSASQFAHYVTSRGSGSATQWSTRDYRAGRREAFPAVRPLPADISNDASDEFSDEEFDADNQSTVEKPQTRNKSSEYSKWSQTADVIDETAGNFSNFRISESMQSKLKAKGIPFLFPVQMSTFNPIFDGKDVIVQARTGSGKTLSYAVPLIEHMQQKAEQQQRRRIPRLLVMTPTRELARQVSEVVASLTNNLSVVTVYGGAPINAQAAQLQSGVDVVVGTPGRIADFLERGTLDLTQLEHVVLDEVDRMLDMGFADDVDQILRHRYTPDNTDKNPQTLLFSATVPPWVQKTAQKYLRSDITKLDLVGRGTVRTATCVEHLAIPCTQRDRTVIIANTLQVYSGAHGRAIIFCETKRDADQLASSNLIRGETHALHGDIPQGKREMVLKGFREGRYRCLIATDVAARGLDIPEVDLVIQCSPPKDVDSYIHRSGRTGRAGRSGVSVLLYRPADLYDVTNVEKIAGIKFKRIRAPSADVLSASATEDAIKSLDRVPESVIERFTKPAEELVNRIGAVPALAAAIAVLTGNDRPASLLTSSPGFTTYMLKSDTKLERASHAWRTLEELIPLAVKNKVTGMKLCADHMGCVFDVPSDCDAELAKFERLTRPMEIPELEEPRVYSDRPGGSGVRTGYQYQGKGWGQRDNDWGHRSNDRDHRSNSEHGGGYRGNKPQSQHSWQHSDSSWQHPSAGRRPFPTHARQNTQRTRDGGRYGGLDEDLD